MLKTPLGVAAVPRVLHSDQLLHAPHLLDIEFAHALRRLAQSGAIQQTSAEQALTDLADLRLIRHPHGPLVQRIWELRSSVSAYDAAYVALAEGLDMPLLTCDAKLSRSHGHRAKIQLLS